MIIHEVEQGSVEWHELRAGKPTASEFKKLLTTQGKVSKSLGDYAAQLAADLYVGAPVDPWGGNEWTERGHEMEDRARAHYELEHKDASVTLAGFCTDEKERYGASPDSLVQFEQGPGGMDHDDFGLLEIKCLKGSNHVQKMVYVDKNNECPTDYFMQVQGQLFVADRTWCDVQFYHPDLPSFEIRVWRDEFIHTELKKALVIVLDKRDQILKTINKFADPKAA